MIHVFLIFSLLMGIWVAFSGQIDGFHLGLGVISSAFVTLISQDLVFSNRKISFGRRLEQGWRLGGYFFWMLWQIVLANLHILGLAFGPRAHIVPSIIRYRTHLESDFEKFLLANSITLTPGTITIKIRGNDFFIHAISEKSAMGVGTEMERRIAAIFNPERGETK